MKTRSYPLSWDGVSYGLFGHIAALAALLYIELIWPQISKREFPLIQFVLLFPSWFRMTDVSQPLLRFYCISLCGKNDVEHLIIFDAEEEYVIMCKKGLKMKIAATFEYIFAFILRFFEIWKWFIFNIHRSKRIWKYCNSYIKIWDLVVTSNENHWINILSNEGFLLDRIKKT